MSLIVFYKLLAIFITVVIGWFAGRMRWLGPASGGMDPARMLSNAAFYIFVPALMFRTTARLDVASLPWATVGGYFVPALMTLFIGYGVMRWLRPPGRVAIDNTQNESAPNLSSSSSSGPSAAERAAAVPSVRAFAMTFSNSVQIGIPLSLALFGEAGLGLHITLVGLHALMVLTPATLLVELDLARARAGSAGQGRSSLWATLGSTVRSTVIHPVVLPVLAGLVWNAAGWPLPGPLDETLRLLASAVAPLCLVMIGLSLAYYGIGATWPAALGIALVKLIAMPATTLVVAHWGFGLAGLPLQIVVLMAALPTGSNPLIFAQRYRSAEAEATAAIVISTVGFVLTAPLWLALLVRF